MTNSCCSCLSSHTPKPLKIPHTYNQAYLMSALRLKFDQQGPTSAYSKKHLADEAMVLPRK